MAKYLDMTGLTYLISKLIALINTKANASHTHNYLSGLSVSGKTITYTKGDGTSGTITTQDTNTTYSAGTGISLSGTTFSNSGVRSIASGSTNGTISVNTNGTSTDVAVKGLGSAAYTASTAYATSGHTHDYIPMSGSTNINGILRTNSEIQSTSANALRLSHGSYGTLLRNDGTATYVLLTNKDDAYGSWNDLRPLTINNSTGEVYFDNGLYGNLNGTASNADTVDGYHASNFVLLSNFMAGKLDSKTAYYNAAASKDCNDIEDFLVLACGADGLHYPTSNTFYYILTFKYTSTNKKQIAFGYNGNNRDKVFYRTYNSTWTDWEQLYTSQDITYGTSALTPGSSSLTTGTLYFQYE